MKMLLRKKKRKVNILLICIIILVFLVFISGYFINYYSRRAIPLLMSYAEAESKKLIILVINKAVTKQINNVDTNREYINTNFTRFYMDYKNKTTYTKTITSYDIISPRKTNIC